MSRLSCKIKPRLTKRAPDVWDSARFTGIFLALGFFYISERIHARPHAGNANRWVAQEQMQEQNQMRL
jgi:hypothetical protein